MSKEQKEREHEESVESDGGWRLGDVSGGERCTTSGPDAGTDGPGGGHRWAGCAVPLREVRGPEGNGPLCQADDRGSPRSVLAARSVQSVLQGSVRCSSDLRAGSMLPADDQVQQGRQERSLRLRQVRRRHSWQEGLHRSRLPGLIVR